VAYQVTAAAAERRQERGRRPLPRRRRRDRAVGEQAVEDVGVELRARHGALAVGRRENVLEALGGDADDDDAVLEHGRIEMGRLAGEDLLLGEEQILERIGREGRRAIGPHRRTAKRHQSAPHRLRRAVVVGHHLFDPRDARVAQHERRPRRRYLLGTDAARGDHRRHRQRRHDPATDVDEGHVAPRRTVGVVGEAGVADAAGSAGQRRERRRQQRPALGESGNRPACLQRRNAVERRLHVLAGVDEAFTRGLGGENHVAGLGHRLHQGLVAFGAGPRRAANLARALRFLAEQHVVDDQGRRSACQVID
jgi:hypothetical protein